MKNNTKKITSILFVAILVPQLALASWWNPLTWFNKWSFKKDNKTEIQQEVVVTENTNEDIKPIESDSNKDEIQELKEEIAKLKEENKENEPKKTNTEIDVCSNMEGIQSVVPKDYVVNLGVCTKVKDLCPNIPGVQSSVPTGMSIYSNTNECLTENQIIEFENSISRENEKQGLIELNNSLVDEYNNKIREIDKQILLLKKEYLNKKESTEKNPNGMMRSALESTLDNLYYEYNSKIYKLELQKDDLYYQYQDKISDLNL